MKIYLISFFLTTVNLYTAIANDQIISQNFENDNLISFKFHEENYQRNLLATPKEGQELEKLIYNIFHNQNDLKNSVDTPKQEDKFEKLIENIFYPDSAQNSTNFTDNLQKFSDDLYKTVSKNKSDNVLLSPLSVNVALSMLTPGAEGNTKNEMLRILHLPENDQVVKSSYKNLVENLTSNTGVTLRILNKVFISSTLQVKQTFKDVLSSSFHADEEQLNFLDSETAAKSINTWVSKGTNDKIKNIVKVDDLSTDTAMIIANVVYFKGEWKYKFSEVSNHTFFTDNHKKTFVPIMYQNADLEFGYVNEINATFIEIPYKDEELKMLIVLPNTIDGLDQVEKSLETMNLRILREKRFFTNVDLYLPKFRVENTIDLNGVLNEMGMKEMFTDSANFSSIAEGNLKVSKIKQKTFIEVNEDGAEVAAVTETDIDWKMGGEDDSIMFVVNHPFHYKIIKTIGENDGIVLFAGNCKYIQ